MSDVENSWGNKSDTDAVVTGGVTIDGISLTNYSKAASIINIADNTKTTILTQTYVLGTLENLAILSVSGDDYAKFFLTKNAVDIDIRRTGPDRNLQFDFTGAPLALVSGDVIDIKVEHFNVGAVLDFDATLYGY
jgi:hypothetical protein